MKCNRNAKDTTKNNDTYTTTESLQDNPGAAIDAALDNKVTPCMVKADVENLNNNPRNDK